MDLKQHLHRQAAFSRATFGPGQRTEAVLDHITKEIEEVRNATNHQDKVGEWVDLVILSFDGLLRELTYKYPEMSLDRIADYAVTYFTHKQAKNELRKWPDWRTADPNKAIEHDRTGE